MTDLLRIGIIVSMLILALAIGIFAWALCIIAARSDREMEKEMIRKEDENGIHQRDKHNGSNNSCTR